MNYEAEEICQRFARSRLCTKHGFELLQAILGPEEAARELNRIRVSVFGLPEIPLAQLKSAWEINLHRPGRCTERYQKHKVKTKTLPPQEQA
jgi:hypothetical protein